MPRSQTPVGSHRLANTSLGLLPSSAKKLSALPSLSWGVSYCPQP